MGAVLGAGGGCSDPCESQPLAVPIKAAAPGRGWQPRVLREMVLGAIATAKPLRRPAGGAARQAAGAGWSAGSTGMLREPLRNA